jgi:hypothetical protein
MLIVNLFFWLAFVMFFGLHLNTTINKPLLNLLKKNCILSTINRYTYFICPMHFRLYFTARVRKSLHSHKLVPGLETFNGNCSL